MLGKLLKYEFIYLVKDFAKTYIIYGATVLIFSILVLGGSSASGTAFVTLFGIFAVIYYIFTFLLAILTISHNVRRFKKNMFSHEGYLTNTLPVTPSQHVIAKVIVGAVNYVISFVVIYLGFTIVMLCAGGADEFKRSMDLMIRYLNHFDLLFPTFLMLATGYLALLLCCYLVSAVSNMVGGSKGKGALLAIAFVILYIFLSVILSSALVDGGTSPAGIMYVYSLVYAAGAVGEFFAITHIIRNSLNLQ